MQTRQRLRGAQAIAWALCGLTAWPALASPPAHPPATAQPAAPAAPWRMADALRAPGWLQVSLTHRSRYEALRDPVRGDTPDTLGAVFMRTTARVGLGTDTVRLVLEGIDARALGASPDLALSTGQVDVLDVLQAHLALSARGVGGADGVLSARVGRMTLDLGSRRLVARNGFRNTINAFDGAELQWTAPRAGRVQAGVVSPVRRLPATADAMRDQVIEQDQASWGAVLGFVQYTGPAVPDLGQIDGGLLGLYESDTADQPTRNRRLLTAHLRIVRPQGRGHVDSEVEVMAQLGQSRASSAAEDTEDLRHHAMFTHLSLGYTADHPLRPRLAALYDFASGDGDPEDAVNGRFDTLFGARRFELGPTGGFGLLARSNLNSPAVRAEVRPATGWRADVTWRGAWLAAATDAWTPTGLRDASSRSGHSVGQQVDARVRWAALPDQLSLEVGAAYLWLGDFATQAPNGPGAVANPAFGYAQVTVQI